MSKNGFRFSAHEDVVINSNKTTIALFIFIFIFLYKNYVKENTLISESIFIIVINIFCTLFENALST